MITPDYIENLSVQTNFIIMVCLVVREKDSTKVEKMKVR